MADPVTSGTTNPYANNYYTPGSNDKNTLTITDYFQLLAAQLKYQDMTNPMDNSEMMAQMTQMAMVQSLTTMNTAMETSTSVTTSTYAAGLIGQEVTVAVTEENPDGTSKPTGVKTGVVESVNFTDYTPIIRLVGDDTDYPLSFVLGMGKIDNPFEKPEEGEGEDKPDGEDGEKPDNSKILNSLPWGRKI